MEDTSLSRGCAGPCGGWPLASLRRGRVLPPNLAERPQPFALAAAVLAAAVAVAGCGRPGAKPEKPDTLVLLGDRDIEGLDPHTSGTLWQTQSVLANLYEGLVAFDPSMALVPALAVSWSNPDDYTWEFQLRRGVAFHTGEALAAEDVVFSLRRAREHPSSVLRAALANVHEIEALGADRVRIRTSEPDASLIYRLREVYVVSRRFLERSGEAALGAASCGTGPYVVAGHAPGTVLDILRFDGYWRGRASIPKARFVGRSYGDPEVARLVRATDPLLFWARPGTDIYARALREAIPHVTPGLTVSYLGFDLHGETGPGVGLPRGQKRNPFRDRRVREAIARTIDNARLAREAMASAAEVPTQLVALPVAGFDPGLPLPSVDRKAARELLVEAGFPHGFQADLDVRAIMARYGSVESLAADLAAIGVQVKVRLQADEDFFDRLRTQRSSLYVLRFSCRTGDAQELLDKWVHSRDPARGYGEANFSYELNPVPGLDLEIEQARRELRVAPRLEKLRKIMARVMEARLAVPLLNERSIVFASPGVEWRPRADTYRLVWEMRFER